jgi:hypothetical protein
MDRRELLRLVPDLLAEPLVRRDGDLYQGRFQISGLQWLLNPDDLHATAVVSARDLVVAADNGLIWTDQLVQRGIKPGRDDDAAIELSLADGYPDATIYVFLPDKSDEIARKLLEGEPRLKLSPLVWNLRPGRFQAAIDASESGDRFYLYKGRVYLPDGHHRHQGIVKAFRLWEDAPDDYPRFDPDRLFTLDLYFMSRRDEAEYFFQKNWLPKIVERSKSYDLTEQDALSVLAKQVIEQAPSLTGNVNRVTDRLIASNPQVVTLSTLREVMHIAAGDALTDEEIASLAPRIAQFWEFLAGVRPELGRLEVDDRRRSRQASMAGQAVVMYGYAELLRRFLADAEASDLDTAVQTWRRRLQELSPDNLFEDPETGWTGDYFARANPRWRELGILQATRSGGETVSNTRQTREQAAKALVERLCV